MPADGDSGNADVIDTPLLPKYPHSVLLMRQDSKKPTFLFSIGKQSRSSHTRHLKGDCGCMQASGKALNSHTQPHLASAVLSPPFFAFDGTEKAVGYACKPCESCPGLEQQVQKGKANLQVKVPAQSLFPATTPQNPGTMRPCLLDFRSRVTLLFIITHEASGVRLAHGILRPDFLDTSLRCPW